MPQPTPPTRVLIVDDDVLILRIQRAMLENSGYVVVGEGRNGQEAIILAQKLHPDVIILDIRMPHLDGITAAREIQVTCPTPIVLVSAHDSPNLIQQASEAGAGAYLIKPARPADLQRAIVIAIARFEDLLKLRELNAQLEAESAEHRRTAAALQESENKYRALVENSPDIIMRFNRQYQHLYVSPAMNNLHLFPSPSDFVGKTHRELGFSADQVDYWEQRIDHVFNTGDAITEEFPFTVSDGKKAIIFECRLIPEFDESGHVHTVLTIARDISARKQAEAALHDSLQTAADIVFAIPAGLFIYHYHPPQDLILINANPEAQRLTNISLAEWYGQEFEHLWPQAAHAGLKSACLKTMQTGEMFETENLTYEDERIAAAYRIHAFRMPGQRLGVAFEDITARKQAEQQLQALTTQLSQSNADLQQFAYAVSHDLQAPLRTVTGFLTLLKQHHREQLDADAKEIIQYAMSGAKRMQAMIEGLLNYSRVHTQVRDFVPTDCEAVLKRVLSDIHFTIEQTQTRITHAPLPMVMGDETQLRRVFQNLILNGIKFQPEDPDHIPEIHISVSQLCPETPATSPLLRIPMWCFAVRDNGIGIAEKHINRLFQVFQRLHTQEEYAGTGIGLAMCRKIIERHSGRIWLDSEEGQGSTFYFTLPNGLKRET